MLTPVDIENKMFKKARIGGYDIDEVEDFLEIIIEDYETLYKENAKLKAKPAALPASIDEKTESYYKSMEEGLNKTIDTAKEQAEVIKENALKEAETIKEKAEVDAKKSLAKIKLEIASAEKELAEKQKLMDIYKIKVTSMLEAQLKILKDED